MDLFKIDDNLNISMLLKEEYEKLFSVNALKDLCKHTNSLCIYIGERGNCPKELFDKILKAKKGIDEVSDVLLNYWTSLSTIKDYKDSISKLFDYMIDISDVYIAMENNNYTVTPFEVCHFNLILRDLKRLKTIKKKFLKKYGVI